MKERLVDELITDFAIHQLVHVHRDGKLVREVRTYPIDPETCSVIELDAEQEEERIQTFAACRRLKAVCDG